jgi:kinesin family member 5
MKSTAEVISGNVNVVCRFRPFNQKEIAMGTNPSVDFNSDGRKVNVKPSPEIPFGTNCNFNFDRVFDMSSTQKQVYDVAAKPIIDSVLEGFNGTIFAYG